MLLLHHIFAIWVLAHMVWAAVLLEKEWRRIRRFCGLGRSAGIKEYAEPLARAEAPQAFTRQ
jgi:hypothetical protein